MNLRSFFAAVAPYLEGHADHAKTALALYGPEGAGSTPARRLKIYGAFCRTHRQEALSLYSHCRALLAHHLGPPAWDDLVERYFVAHPMTSWELNENGAHLSTFLASFLATFLASFLASSPASFQAAADGQARPAWPGTGPGEDPSPWMAILPGLADFEWWEWQTQIAPDSDADAAPESGPLRLSSTVELRRYAYDFIEWLDERGAATDLAAAGEPEPGDHLVLFWRDPQGGLRREPVSPLELVVLRLVSEGKSLAAALSQARGLGLPQDDLRDTFIDLHQAGVLLGQLV